MHAQQETKKMKHSLLYNNTICVLFLFPKESKSLMSPTLTHTHFPQHPFFLAGASGGEVICAKASCSMCRAAEAEGDCG